MCILNVTRLENRTSIRVHVRSSPSFSSLEFLISVVTVEGYRLIFKPLVLPDGNGTYLLIVPLPAFQVATINATLMVRHVTVALSASTA